MKLKDQVAIVTGGAKGMGKAVSLALANEGADVVVTARRLPPLEELAEEIRSIGRRSLAISSDITKWNEVSAMVEKTIDRFGKVDILVNVAGVTGPLQTPTWEVKEEDWDHTLAVNLKGTFLCSKAVLKDMIRRRSGNIVNFAGTSGTRGYPYRSPYSCSKWAVIGFTRTLALEVGPYNIRVNAVSPGATEGGRMTRIMEYKAKLWGKNSDEVRQQYCNDTALKRFLQPQEIAAAVLFLVTDGTGITGQAISVDAGWDV